MSTIQLITHEAIGVDDKPIEFDQWFVVVDGIKLGLLCKRPESTIMPLLDGNKLSDDQWIPIVAECATIAGHIVNPPFHFYVPPDAEIEEENEEEEDTDEPS